MDAVAVPSPDFVGDHLVVDLPYEAVVTQVLNELQPRLAVAGAVRDDNLGLALLSLTGVEAYAAANAGYDASLDAVLAGLRSWFETHCGGWMPEMGKNRGIDAVVGSSESKPMSGGVPGLAVAADLLPIGTTGGRGVRVGVLDTAFTPHPGLTADVHASSGSAPAPAAAAAVPPWAGHATFVTGLIAHQAPAAEIVVQQVLDNATGRAYAWPVATAMASFATDDLDVLNLSFGCRTLDGRPPLVLRRAVEVVSRTTLIVAAAGNHGATDNRLLPTWPAALPGVVAVGAARDSDLSDAGEPTLAEFSPRLPWVTCVAPGVDVVSTYLFADVAVHPEDPDKPPTTFDGFARWSGTSFAAASVSGAVAKGTVPGLIDARGSLVQLLDTPNPVVKRYVWRP
jgi:hypothetical protein